MSTSQTGRRFQFIREIASGGFGSVYLAKVEHGDGFARMAAVKLLHPKWSENDQIASRMRDEARLLGWLRHRNIVEVYDLTKINGRVAVIMEYLDAVDVKVVTQWGHDAQESIPIQAALEVCAAVASALDAAYNRPPYAGEKPLRVIHRDIKPSNIMIDAQGQVKVLDFGVARADFAERESRTEDMSFGSIDYMPPERLFFEPDSATSDIYSLGAMLFELLALEKFGKSKLKPELHRVMFDDRWTAVRQVTPFASPEIERELRQLLESMLAFDADDRPMPADCAGRMRALARRAGDGSLEEWAERTLPPLIAQFQTRSAKPHSDSLVNRTIVEDSRGFSRDEETSEVDKKPKGASAQRKPALPEDDDELDLSRKMTDERWKKLKQQTLADLEPPPTRAAAAPPRAPAPPPPGGRPTPEPTGRRGSAPSREENTEVAQPPRKAPPADAAGGATMFIRNPRLNPKPPPPPEDEEEPPPPPPPPPPPKKKGSSLGLALVGFVLVLLVGGGLVLALGAGVGAVWWAGQAPAPAPVAVEAVPEPEKPKPKPKAPKGPSAHFVSEVSKAKKILAKCTGGDAEGVAEAWVAGEAPGDCTVTVIDEGRKKYVAVLKGVTAGTWRCFGADPKLCVADAPPPKKKGK